MSETDKIARRVSCPDCARQFGSEQALKHHQRSTHENPQWVPSKSRLRPSFATPICPLCGGTVTMSKGAYGMKAECCGLWSWNGKPLVGRTTHKARIFAHEEFDQLWKSGRLSRGECYRRLQVETGLSKDECHIALMTAEQALRVVKIVRSGAMLDPKHDKVPT